VGRSRPTGGSSCRDHTDIRIRGASGRTPIGMSVRRTAADTVCRKTSNGQMSGVLTRRPLPEPTLQKPPGKSH
jgi:hypothetical protein